MPSNALFLLFRIVAFIEGLSWLVLLFIAMPLKYMADSPEMVTMVGRAHGGLFIAFVILGIIVSYKYEWTPKLMLYAFLASLLPFGTFYFDYWLHRPAQKWAIQADGA